jgi:hypothetical protein
MKSITSFLFVVLAMYAMLSSGWVAYSQQRECPANAKPIDQEQFFSAHGITQDNYSIWLKEHSAWRNKYQNELESFTFIPRDNDTNRSQ